MFSRVVVERYFGQALEWLERRRSEPREWAEVGDFGDRILYATPDEMRELDEQITELLDAFLDRLEDPAKRPPGARPVNLIQLVFPLPEETLPDRPAEE